MILAPRRLRFSRTAYRAVRVAFRGVRRIERGIDEGLWGGLWREPWKNLCRSLCRNLCRSLCSKLCTKRGARGAFGFVRAGALSLACTALLAGCPHSDGGNASPSPGVEAGEPEALQVRVIARYPHDHTAFTQGLEWFRGHIYESTGLHGQSSVRRVVMKTGEVEARTPAPSGVFGEGLTRVNLQLIQLTWRDRHAVVWDLITLQPVGRLNYEGEGWGLCFDGQRLVMSDGSNTLSFRNAKDFSLLGTVEVTWNKAPVDALNELECVDGLVYANVWQKDLIVRIDPQTGAVTGWVDARGLLAPSEREGADVLNGIAYLPESGHFALTGKHWPYLFEVEFEPASAERSPAR